MAPAYAGAFLLEADAAQPDWQRQPRCHDQHNQVPKGVAVAQGQHRVEPLLGSPYAVWQLWNGVECQSQAPARLAASFCRLLQRRLALPAWRPPVGG